MADNREQLKEAYSLIKSGRKSEAARMLAPIVKSDPRNANAWWLMANAVGNDDHKIKALEKVLQLRPDHPNAQKMLDALRPEDDLPDPFDDIFDDDPVVTAASDTSGSSSPPIYDPYAEDDPDDDPFAGLDDDDDDPFAVMDGGSSSSKFLKDVDSGSSKKQRPAKKSGEKSSNRTLYIVLGVIGVLVLFACGGCFFITQTLGTELGSVMEEVMENVTVNPDGSFTSGGVSSGAPADAIMRGSIEPGQSLPGTVDTFDDDAWTVNLNSGDRVTIEVNARDNTLDPQAFLYAPGGALVAENDDIDFASGNTNSRIEATVDETGTFTIVVSAFGEGGPYDLTVRR